MHSGPAKLEWHGKTLAGEPVVEADPLSSALFVFIIGKQLRRYLSGTIYADERKRLFIQIKEYKPDSDCVDAPEGAYIRAWPGAKLICRNEAGLSLKPGFYTLQQIIRGFYTKRIEQISGKDFARQQSTIFRTIDQTSRFLIEGVYQIVHVLSEGCPYCCSNNINAARANSAPEPADKPATLEVPNSC